MGRGGQKSLGRSRGAVLAVGHDPRKNRAAASSVVLGGERRHRLALERCLGIVRPGRPDRYV
jgi:hypothetical protein